MMEGARRKRALVTGASSGIGLEVCKLLAHDGFDVVLVARTSSRLEELAAQLRLQYGVQTAVMVSDLAKPSAPEEIFHELHQREWRVDVLVNNAGFGVFGKFSDTSLSDEMDLIQVNAAAVTHLTKLFLPPMLLAGYGKILNVASTAAFQPGPLMAVYYASKAYVLSFTEALANELKGTGVTATVLCPGPTETRFQERARMEESGLFRSVPVMDAVTVAVEGYRGMMAGKTVVIPGLRNKALVQAVRALPRTMVTNMVRSVQNRRRSAA